MGKKEELEKLVQNPAFVAESQNVNSIDELIALYNKYGVEITSEDLAGLSRTFAAAKKTEEIKKKYAPKEGKRDNTKALIVIILVGLIIFLSGLPKAIRCTETKMAIVLAVDENISETSRRGSQNTKATVYKPVIEYKVDNKVYNQQWGIWSNIKAYHEGESVNIRYNPSNPEDFVVDRFGGFNMANLFGLFMAAFAGFNLIRKKLFMV